jgi:Amt family ammonium transporter
LIVKATVGLRVSEQDEERGLDFVAHGEEAYDPMNG